MYDTRSIECGAAKDQESCVADGSQCGSGGSSSGDSMSLTTRRRRLFHRQACILSVMAAFALGLALGVFVPLLSLGSAWIDGEFQNAIATVAAVNTTSTTSNTAAAAATAMARSRLAAGGFHYVDGTPDNRHQPAHFPTIYDIQRGPAAAPAVAAPAAPAAAVQFLGDVKLPVETVFRNAFYLEEHKDTDTMTVKKLDAIDGTIKEFTVQRLADGLFRKSAERRLSKPTAVEEMLQHHVGGGTDAVADAVVEFVPHGGESPSADDAFGVIERDIYWGATVEAALPVGFNRRQTEHWNEYLRSGVVTNMEPGCGRMQNRMVTFQDGTRACARYRQNTDQIQGELFSFYLGRLLNISNLAPSGASIIDMKSSTWQLATSDIQSAQWKSMKPVVLTQWLPDLEPAGIPQPFQPLERHLNKLDVRNITGSLEAISPAVENTRSDSDGESSVRPLKKAVLQRLIELAQWSDLIVFDYLIANLDRVVNNLYNYQWNADIMAAPAHNLAQQRDTALLVFLDNESGLLHGYRLLKKYEAYHGLLLDNLCVFRRPTVDALRQLRADGVGGRLQRMFEATTQSSVRDVLPPLPEKSIKILNDRIDRVLGQVQKCRELFSS